jgi:predicted DNA-binding transcriptional regulator AlpA
MSQEVRKLQFISPSLTPPEGSAMPATDTDDQFGTRKGPTSVDPLLTAEEVALRLRVSKDWVWDHSSRKTPRLPVIRMGDGALRYKASRIEEFISERERISAVKHGRR